MNYFLNPDHFPISFQNKYMLCAYNLLGWFCDKKANRNRRTDRFRLGNTTSFCIWLERTKQICCRFLICKWEHLGASQTSFLACVLTNGRWIFSLWTAKVGFLGIKTYRTVIRNADDSYTVLYDNRYNRTEYFFH